MSLQVVEGSYVRPRMWVQPPALSVRAPRERCHGEDLFRGRRFEGEPHDTGDSFHVAHLESVAEEHSGLSGQPVGDRRADHGALVLGQEVPRTLDDVQRLGHRKR